VSGKRINPLIRAQIARLWDEGKSARQIVDIIGGISIPTVYNYVGPRNGTRRSAGKMGFAAMDKDKQREIASKGGKTAQARGTAHQFTTDEAREAGKKGGSMIAQDRDHMAEIGRLGGRASQGGGRPKKQEITNALAQAAETIGKDRQAMRNLLTEIAEQTDAKRRRKK